MKLLTPPTSAERLKSRAADVQESIQQFAQVMNNLMPDIQNISLERRSDLQNERPPSFSK